MIKRLIAILLVLVISLTLFSCGKREEDPSETENYVLPTQVINADISFPYMSSDSMAPYSAISATNRNLIPVMYESLYAPTKDGKGNPLLAADGKVEGKTVTVKLVDGVQFSDGVELNAAYVKASFEFAKKNDYYKASLADVASVKVIDNNTIVFNLSRENPFALNILNFPVIRISNGKSIGSGKYKLQYLEDTPYFQVNTLHREYKDSFNKQIALFDMAGVSSPIYPFKANKISVYSQDLIAEKYVNLSSETVSIPMNNFVYLGVNSRWAGSLTSIDWVRQAINIGIDRSNVGASSFLGQTDAVITPYRTEFYQLNTENLPSVSGETRRAIDILERNGYDKFNADGIRTNGVTALRVNILVCTENEYKKSVAEAVKKSLEDLGFGVSITEKKNLEDFKKALNEGHYSLYIGETQLSYDYNLQEFFKNNGQLSYGISEDFFAQYENYRNGTDSFMTFIEGFETEVPFVPLFYRKSIVSVNPNITGVNAQDIYSSACLWQLQD